MGRAFSVLLQITDSALPTGAFSHSFGLEQYLSRGSVHDAATYEAWLRSYLRSQLTYTDALLVRLAHERLDAGDQLLGLADLALAVTLPEQIRQAGITMAKRLRAIGTQALGVPEPRMGLAHPALEFAVIAHHVGVDATTAAHAHVTSCVTALTQNAVRGIPIGQSAGQAIIARAHDEIERTVTVASTLATVDLGAVAPGLEIAQMQHERLRARMFMS